MRAEVKYFEWLDIERDQLSAEERALTLLTFAAGPIGGVGQETFTVTVCTVRALAELVARDGVVIGRHFLFVDEIDTDRVEAVIQDRLRRLDGRTWKELAEKIGHIGSWEFEDYSPMG